MGEGSTPLVEGPEGTSVKCEYVSPSGSFKDRGSSVLITAMRSAGVEDVFLDSSGNAGASMAMYAAAAGMRCEVLVPESTPLGKTRQAEAHGAKITRIDGPREAVAAAARELADSRVYASHNWQPLFIHGTKTLAHELVDECGAAGVPDHIVLPVGYGSLLLGLHLGFTELIEAGVLKAMPRLHAAQAEQCAPIHAAFVAGAGDVVSIAPAETVASAIASSSPVRGTEIMSALRSSVGTAVAVPEPDIMPARQRLAGAGFYVEPSSAVAFAAVRQLRALGTIGDDEAAMVVLTGSGLKS